MTIFQIFCGKNNLKFNKRLLNYWEARIFCFLSQFFRQTEKDRKNPTLNIQMWRRNVIKSEFRTSKKKILNIKSKNLVKFQ